MNLAPTHHHLQLLLDRVPLWTLLKVLIVVNTAALQMHHHNIPDKGQDVSLLLRVLLAAGVELEAGRGEAGQQRVQRPPHHRQHEQQSELRGPEEEEGGEILK